MTHFFSQIMHWIVKRLSCTPERDNQVTAWFIFSFWLATTGSAIILAIGNPTGASLAAHAVDIGKAVGINVGLFLIWTIIIGAVLSFIYIPLPRFLLASLSYTMFTTVFILQSESNGKLFSYIIGVGYSLLAIVVGLFLILLFHKKIGKTIKIAMVASIFIFGSMYLVFDKIENKRETVPAIAEYTDPITDENPADKGDFDYTFLTYGSGTDLHREAFGAAVDQVTPTVDASDFITTWGKDREKFWGFGPAALPVNGRTFLPEGTGPFPVILMVHGNHTMEYFSTSGYDYLGELLASRGFITISVDEDFINYSNAYGSPNDNYELRAWMFLKHLDQLQHMNDNVDSALYQKIDFDQVALVGHSRGGQAAPMAADYTTFFDDEALIESMANINIKAAVAIAPTDKSVDGHKPNLHNVSYLLLHGARDADLYNFRGDQQFYRTTFDPDDDGFKTSLYIEDANHTQFNTDWGRMDLSLPRGLFLNQKQTMAPEDQQQIAKVYMSAFFESVFNGHESYQALFQDHRYGQNWLPDTTLVNKYRHASYQPIMTFDNYEDEAFDGDGFVKWDVITPKDRADNSRPKDALQLEWETDASYTLDIANLDLLGRKNIVLTMANVDDKAENERLPDIQIELETTDGVSVQLPLDDFMPFSPIIKTDYTHFGLLDNIFRDGKYKKSWEPIFQTFEIPMETFAKNNTAFEQDKISKITLYFESHPGKILLEEIGAW